MSPRITDTCVRMNPRCGFCLQVLDFAHRINPVQNYKMYILQYGID